jgi:hypothetical protein
MIIGVGTFVLARYLLRRYPPKVAYSYWCAFCAALNSFSIAFIFSPTLLVSGWFGFPAPAGFVLICCLFDTEFRRNNNELIRKNFGGAMILFTGFWFIAWLVSIIRRSKKLQKPGGVSLAGNSITIIAIASILLAIIFYYFAFCYAQPPKGEPVYQGP